MKTHYSGEFNAAALMRAKPNWDASDDEDDDKWKCFSIQFKQ